MPNGPQELKLEQSLEEYVKAAMLIEMLAGGPVEPSVGFRDVVYDLSVGYDLAGIRSEPVRRFLRGMLDARTTVERLRRRIPDEYAKLRDLDFPTNISDTLTLSTFHGCPPDEIEAIIDYLLREYRLNCIVKLNPMLLGADETRHLLHDVLGYHDLEVPDSAFERDTSWQQAVEFFSRLATTADSLGLGLGAKFTNTLIVRNNAGFLPAEEEEVYLSGQPLHVLAMHLVRRFRREFGARLPISFSAGIDRFNYPDAVALGLVPVTVCTDLLRKGGYGRLAGYHAELRKRMVSVGARSIEEYIVRAYGLGIRALERAGVAPGSPRHRRTMEALENGEEIQGVAGETLWRRWVEEAMLVNTEHYVERVTVDPRYSQAQNAKPPRKIGSHLELFDCVTCDICVPVCPNDANFTFGDGPRELPIEMARRRGEVWERMSQGTLRLERKHQIGNFADFCNDCGNCDVFCPEDGGPYIIKPRFFSSESAWREAGHLDGFFIARSGGCDVVLGRFEGSEYGLLVGEGSMTYSGEGFQLSGDANDSAAPLTGEGPDEVDLTYRHLMEYLRSAVLDGNGINYVNNLWSVEE